jgi:hypothetical protein
VVVGASFQDTCFIFRLVVNCNNTGGFGTLVLWVPFVSFMPADGLFGVLGMRITGLTWSASFLGHANVSSQADRCLSMNNNDKLRDPQACGIATNTIMAVEIHGVCVKDSHEVRLHVTEISGSPQGPELLSET